MNKNILVFYSNTNTKGRNDASGAFIPEAKAFATHHQVPDENFVGMKLIGNTLSLRRQLVLERIVLHKGKLDAIAFFGHGWPSGIQFGFNKSHIEGLVSIMRPSCYSHVKVLLYACWTAENETKDKDHNNVGVGTDNGFADMLRDEMARKGMIYGWVDGHKTAGHTSWNPYAVRFHCRNVKDYAKGAVGGCWLVQPGSTIWKEWVAKLRNAKTGLRYDYPFMEDMEIQAMLSGIQITKFTF